MAASIPPSWPRDKNDIKTAYNSSMQINDDKINLPNHNEMSNIETIKVE